MSTEVDPQVLRAAAVYAKAKRGELGPLPTDLVALRAEFEPGERGNRLFVAYLLNLHRMRTIGGRGRQG
jgi:hypothetical protein